MSSALTRLLWGQLNSLSNPLSESDLRSLAILTSSSILIDALDLVDKGSVSEVSLPSGRTLYQVAGTSGSYSVTPNLPSAVSTSASIQGSCTRPLGYCPCPAFSYAVFKQDNQVICKHLLALHIALHLSSADPGSKALVKKEMGLKWIAAFSTGFAPVQAAPGAGAG